MSMSAFAHATAAAGSEQTLVQLLSFNVNHFPFGVTATAGVRLLNTGAQQSRVGVAYTTETTWLQSGANSDYEVRCTLDSGSLSFGTTGTWQLLSTTREWYVQDTTGGGFITAEITLEIRLAASPFTVLESSTHTLSAEQGI